MEKFQDNKKKYNDYEPKYLHVINSPQSLLEKIVWKENPNFHKLYDPYHPKELF